METFYKAQGGKELRKHLLFKKLTLRQMVLAKCYECTGHYADGRIDCNMPECPLYPIMPYGEAYRGRVKKKISPDHVFAMHQKQKRGKMEAI